MFSSGTCTRTPAHQQKYAPAHQHTSKSMHQRMHQLRHTPALPPVEFSPLWCNQWWMRQKQNQPHFVAVFPLFCKKIKQFAAAIDAVSLYYIIVMGARFGKILFAKIQFLYIISVCTLWKDTVFLYYISVHS